MRVLRLVLLSSLFLGGAALGQLRVGPSLAVTPDVSDEGQGQARATATADGFFVVWQAGVGLNAKVRGARLGADGISLDPAGLTLSEGLGGRFEPAVAFGHGVTFVVWSDLRGGQSAIYGSRVSPQGEVIDPTGVLLSTEPGARMPDVAATPTGFVVGWAQTVQGGQGTEARARLLSPTGMGLGAPLRLSSAASWQSGEDFAHDVIHRTYCQNVRVAVEGTSAFVVWMGNLGNSQAMSVARALIDTSTGTLAAPADFTIPWPQSRVWDPAIAAQGDGGVLISWTDLQGRGNAGLPAHNAVIAPLFPSDAGFGLIAFKADGGVREVLRPALSSAGLVAFVQGEFNPQRRRTEWRLRLRQVLADGSSPGADVTLSEQAVWPAIVTNASGVTLLVSTSVNGPIHDTGRLRARLVSR